MFSWKKDYMCNVSQRDLNTCFDVNRRKKISFAICETMRFEYLLWCDNIVLLRRKSFRRFRHRRRLRELPANILLRHAEQDSVCLASLESPFVNPNICYLKLFSLNFLHAFLLTYLSLWFFTLHFFLCLDCKMEILTIPLNYCLCNTYNGIRTICCPFDHLIFFVR